MTDMMTTEQPRPHRLPVIVGSYIALVAIAFLINALFGNKSLLAIASGGLPIVEQARWGVAFAMMAGIPLWLALRYLPSWMHLRTQLVQLVGQLDMSGLNPLWIAILAGCGEETLFRGALQPIVGVWWSSLMFVAGHFQSYQLGSFNWQKGVLAAIAFVASLLLGWIFTTYGLIAAIVMHATVDIGSLFLVRWLAGQPSLVVQQSTDGA